MVRKLLIGLVVLPTVLLAGAILVLHLRGTSLLQAELARLSESGEVLDIRRLAPPPVPATSNGLSLLLSSQRRLAALGDASVPAPFEMMTPGVAIPPTLRGTWGEGSRRTNTWQHLEALHGGMGPDLERLQEALAFPWRRPNRDWSQGFGIMFPELAPMKSCAVVLGNSALVHARRRDFTNALADLQDLRIVQEDLAPEPLLIHQLVRIAIASIGTSRAWAILNAHDWTDGQLAALQDALVVTNMVEGLVQSLRGERAWVVGELRTKTARQLGELFDVSGNAMNLAFGTGPSPLEAPDSMEAAAELAGTVIQRLGEGFKTRILFPLWYYAFGEMSQARYLRITQEWIRVQDQAAKVRDHRWIEKARLEDLLKPRSFGDLVLNLIPNLLLPALSKAASKAYRAETEASLVRVAIALRRYQQRNARLPESLGELVPQFLASVPIDGMDGQPLRYRREASGGYTLWSTGQDGTDDGGDPEPSEAGRVLRNWWTGRDAVLPRPATPDEARAWEQETEERETRKPSRATPSGASVPSMSAELLKRYGLAPTPPSTASTNGPKPEATSVPAQP